MPRVEAKQKPVEMEQLRETAEAPSNVLLELPIGQHKADFRLHVNLQLTIPMSIALRRLTAGYMSAGATMKNGRKVDDPTDALRRLLEDLSDATAKNT